MSDIYTLLGNKWKTVKGIPKSANMAKKLNEMFDEVLTHVEAEYELEELKALEVVMAALDSKEAAEAYTPRWFVSHINGLNCLKNTVKKLGMLRGQRQKASQDYFEAEGKPGPDASLAELVRWNLAHIPRDIDRRYLIKVIAPRRGLGNVDPNHLWQIWEGMREETVERKRAESPVKRTMQSALDIMADLGIAKPEGV